MQNFGKITKKNELIKKMPQPIGWSTIVDLPAKPILPHERQGLIRIYFKYLYYFVFSP